MNIVIPMAGSGKRFVEAGYTKPKPFIDVLGKPMIVNVLHNLSYSGAKFILIASKDHMDKEKETVKLYYSIGEVSKIFNVNASLIRFWEKEFNAIKPKKNKKGNRMFTQKDVDNFHLIFNLVKERGFTLDGAKQHLQENKGDATSNLEMIKSLNKLKEFLQELKKGL